MSQRALNGQQFQQMEMFINTNPVGPSAPPAKRVLPVGRDAYTGTKPVGMRGRAIDRFTLPDRLAKQAQGRDRWESLRARIDDGDNDEDYDDGDHRPLHPRTGLPMYGEIKTHGKKGLGMGSADVARIGDSSETAAVPRWATYHGSTPSARRMGSEVKEIPLHQSSDPELPGWNNNLGPRPIATPQDTVSAQRLHEALDRPETTASPRLPYREMPYVYQVGEGMSEHNTVIDGNHRTGAHILQGQMFMQARVVTPASKGVVQAQTSKINNAKKRALFDQHGNDRSEQVEQRMNDRLYGTGNW